MRAQVLKLFFNFLTIFNKIQFLLFRHDFVCTTFTGLCKSILESLVLDFSFPLNCSFLSYLLPQYQQKGDFSLQTTEFSVLLGVQRRMHPYQWKLCSTPSPPPPPPPGKIPSPVHFPHNIFIPLNKVFHFYFIFILFAFFYLHLHTQVVLILILIDAQYFHNVVVSFEKGLNGQNHSSSDSHHPIKSLPQQNFPYP